MITINYTHITDYTDSKGLTNAIKTNGKTLRTATKRLVGLAKAAFHHSAEFGDANPLSTLIIGLPNGVRKNALIGWVEEHSPLKWGKNKAHPEGFFHKDKTETAKPYSLEAALGSDPFAKPSVEGVDWDTEKARIYKTIINGLAKLNEHGDDYDMADFMKQADELTAKRVEKEIKALQKAA